MIKAAPLPPPSMMGWMSALELRQRLSDIGVGKDRDAEILVARACRVFGLVASGFEYQLLTGASGKPHRIEQSTATRTVVREPFWRVFESSDRSEAVTTAAGWRDGYFFFEFESLDKERGQFHRRAFNGMMFDRAGAEAVLAEISQQLNDSPEACTSEPQRSVDTHEADFKKAIRWCNSYASRGTGRNSDKAWKEFSRLGQFAQYSRAGFFRPAWVAAKKRGFT